MPVDVFVEAIVENAVVNVVGALVLVVAVDNVGNNVDNSPVVETGATVDVIGNPVVVIGNPVVVIGNPVVAIGNPVVGSAVVDIS
jgi:hypothetical protein